MKTKKITKIFAATGLALIMGAGVLCGTLIPMNSAQVGVFGGATSASNSGDPAALAQTTDSAQAEWAENILSGDLNLDPENDPVVFTTETGVDIKFGAATLSSGALSGYFYFSMGIYSDTAVNWVIIGRSDLGFNETTFNTLAWHVTGNGANSAITSWINNFFEVKSAAGVALYNDNILFDRVVGGNAVNVATNVVVNSEIPQGCVLCLSEKNLGTIMYDDYGVDQKWTQEYVDDCDLKDAMLNRYQNLNLTDTQKKLIIPQTLKTFGNNNSVDRITTTTNNYFFPLAAQDGSIDQNFILETYLNSTALKISYEFGSTNAQAWWSRSGYKVNSGSRAYLVSQSGSYSTHWTDYYYGVRPAFVLKLA